MASLCLIPTSEPVQTVICISKIQKTKDIVYRNVHRSTTNSESCLLIFFGGVRKNAKHPHFDVPENLQYTSDYESNFLNKFQMLNLNRWIMFVGYNWYQTPHSLTMPLLFILLTQKLQVDVMPPKLKHYFLMSWTSLFPNTKEYSLLISFKNGLYGKNASFNSSLGTNGAPQPCALRQPHFNHFLNHHNLEDSVRMKLS